MIGWFTKKKSGTDAAGQEPVAAADAAEGGSSPPAAVAAPEAAPKGLLQRLQAGLTKTRQSLVQRVDALFLGRKEIDAELLEELEEILITADLGVSTTMELLEEIRARVSRRELKEALCTFLQQHGEAS